MGMIRLLKRYGILIFLPDDDDDTIFISFCVMFVGRLRMDEQTSFIPRNRC